MELGYLILVLSNTSAFCPNLVEFWSSDDAPVHRINCQVEISVVILKAAVDAQSRPFFFRWKRFVI